MFWVPPVRTKHRLDSHQASSSFARWLVPNDGANAALAAAHRLACLFWCLLTHGEDYAHQQPSLTAKKLRLLEISPSDRVRRAC
jgi:hypothetical protein